MTQDLQQLLEKINTDGVEKAKSEAAGIVAQANAQAKKILASATHEAEQTIAQARQEAEAFERRAEETVRQSARNTLLTVAQSVTAMLTSLLRKEVHAAMSDPGLVATLAAEAVRAYLGGAGGSVEVVASERLADTLRATLAGLAKDGVTVVTDGPSGAGFKVRLEDGRIEHDFTGAAVAAALARGLRPRLAALLNASGGSGA